MSRLGSICSIGFVPRIVVVLVLLLWGAVPAWSQLRSGVVTEPETVETPQRDPQTPLVFQSSGGSDISEASVAGRDQKVFRKPDSLLSRAVGSAPLVDQNQLHTRRQAMADGTRFTDSLEYVGRQKLEAGATMAAASAGATRARQPLMGRWGVVVLGLMVVGLGGLYLASRKGLLNRSRPVAVLDPPLCKSDRPRMNVSPSRREFLP